MLTLRKANDRGQADHGWLKSAHTFSFADYHDPAHMGFSLLRVINEDHVAPGTGFGKHPHRDMEIVTYVLSGTLTHEDSMGNREQLKAGEVQRMSAGSGVLHSEFNNEPMVPVHLLQIWLQTGERGRQPDYEQKSFPRAVRLGQIVPIVTPDGAGGSLRIHTDASILLAQVEAGSTLEHPLPAGRRAWVQATQGELTVDGQILKAGDGAALSEVSSVRLGSDHGGEALVFDLP